MQDMVELLKNGLLFLHCEDALQDMGLLLMMSGGLLVGEELEVIIAMFSCIAFGTLVGGACFTKIGEDI